MSTSQATAKSPPQPLPTSRYSKWRFLCLASVYVLMSLHVLHWLVAGKTLAPLELHEVMFTAELGIITAGFLLMLTITIATFVFGRFFCSWGCHIMALQEAASGLLGKVGIRPRPIRSRLLIAVPPLVLLYMFGWPQIARMWEARPFPDLRTQTDLEGISSFVTADFWRNLPDPWITALTFFVCGFLIVYVLGARSFCTYGCPYGALFVVADRFAPGRIRVDQESCVQCGTCTAVCTSGVSVHKEVKTHGTIVNPRCLKDLDCVSACPENALHFGFGAPALSKLYEMRWGLLALAVLTIAVVLPLFWTGAHDWWSGRYNLVVLSLAVVAIGILYTRSGKPARSYDFAGWEELLMGGAWLATLLIYRQLYDTIPFLLTVGLGGVVGFLCVLVLRLLRRNHVRAFARQLKHDGKIRPAGWIFAATMFVFLAFSIHSAVVQVEKNLGYAEFERYEAALAAGNGAAPQLAGASLGHLLRAEEWGLFSSRKLDERLSTLLLARGESARAESYLRRSVERTPADAGARTELGRVLLQAGRYGEAEAQLQEALRVRAISRAGEAHLLGVRSRAHYYLAEVQSATGRSIEAESSLVEAIRINPDFAEARYSLGVLALGVGRPEDGAEHLREAIRLQPGMAAAHYNLAVALFSQSRLEEAIAETERALALDPSDAQAQAFLVHLNQETVTR